MRKRDSASNQCGYDVVSTEGERIPIKTITTSDGIRFNPAAFGEVDRVIVLRVDVDPEEGISVEELLDKPVSEARALGRYRHRAEGKTVIAPRA